MANEINKAKIKVEFEDTYVLDPGLTYDEALKQILEAVAQGIVSDASIKVEYNNGFSYEFKSEKE